MLQWKEGLLQLRAVTIYIGGDTAPLILKLWEQVVSFEYHFHGYGFDYRYYLKMIFGVDHKVTCR